MTTSPSAHIVVVGGGILGVSTTAQLAAAGAPVTLVTSGGLADGASGRSIAWLNSSGKRSAAYHYLRMLALDRYRTWSARHPESTGYLRFDGAMKWAKPGGSLRETFAFERTRGYDSRWVQRDEVHLIAADVAAEAVAGEGAIYNAAEGWVNLPDLIAALAAEAVRDGARIVENAGDARVAADANGVSGVVLGDGTRLDADRVVLATGAGVPPQLAALGVSIPDASRPAAVVFTAPVGRRVRTVLNTPRVAVRPLPDGGLALDSGWAERSIVVGEDGRPTVPEDTIRGLLDEASRVIEGSPELLLARVGVGLKPLPGDGEPVVGAVPGIPGLFAAFTHSGATLGLILGELLAEEVLTGEPSPVLSAFRIDRFADRDGTTAAADGEAWEPVARESR